MPYSLHRCALTLLAAAAVPLHSPDAALAGSNMRDNLIQHYCLKAVNAEFSSSGMTPPAGMPEFTCTCVVQQVNARASISKAQSTCKQQATTKYNLAP